VPPLNSRLPLPCPAERKRLRELFGVTQHELAAELGVTRKTVYTWERRERIPPGTARALYSELLSAWARTETAVATEIKKEGDSLEVR
jgi:DNA-binding XRE family transcriptional regulator